VSEKRHELYLVALGLAMAAGLIFYNVFSAPAFHAVKVPSKEPLPTQAVWVTEVEATETAQAGTGGQKTTEQSGLPAAEAPQTQAAEPDTKPATSRTGPVNINTAGLEELMTLDGIGEVKAAAIIEYRRENGAFSSVEELLKVKGIGEKTLAKIRDQITL